MGFHDFFGMQLVHILLFHKLTNVGIQFHHIFNVVAIVDVIDLNLGSYELRLNDLFQLIFGHILRNISNN